MTRLLSAATRSTATRSTATLSTALAFLLPLAPAHADDAALAGLKSRVAGTWTSISCELRPQQNPADPAAAPTPTYLTRDFTFEAEGGFSAMITIFADPACTQPTVLFSFAGEVVWHGPNPAAPGAYSQDYVLNAKLELTPLAQPFADQLNALPEGACGQGAFAVGEAKDVLGQPCVLVRFEEGNPFVVDHDLLYVREDMPDLLFMGAKHVDGTGFYAEENRPQVGLQQPLLRVE